MTCGCGSNSCGCGVEVHIHDAESKRSGPYVFPKRKAYPIGNLEHAKLALTFSTWPDNKKDAKKVRDVVFKRYPQLREWFKDGKYEKHAESFDAELNQKQLEALKRIREKRNKSSKKEDETKCPCGGDIVEALVCNHCLEVHRLYGAESFEAEKINTFSEIENEWKDSSVTIYDEDADEFYGIKEILVQEGDDVLEDGHPYLVLNKDSGDLDSQVFYRDFQTGYDAESVEAFDKDGNVIMGEAYYNWSQPCDMCDGGTLTQEGDENDLWVIISCDSCGFSQDIKMKDAESFDAEKIEGQTQSNIYAKFFVGHVSNDELRGNGKFKTYDSAVKKAKEVAKKEGNSRVVSPMGAALWTSNDKGLFQAGHLTTEAKRFYNSEEEMATGYLSAESILYDAPISAYDEHCIHQGRFCVSQRLPGKNMCRNCDAEFGELFPQDAEYTALGVPMRRIPARDIMSPGARAVRGGLIVLATVMILSASAQGSPPSKEA